jgi:ketosteroid isomerase-like protein
MPNQKAENSDVIDWLEQWAKAIRDSDLSAGRKLFSKNASGFGTITNLTRDLDDLIERQWTEVWENTKDFDFDWCNLKIHRSPDGILTAVHALWSSVNMAGNCRDGRATIILLRTSEQEKWQCIHTHFSLRPNGADPGQLK